MSRLILARKQIVERQHSEAQNATRHGSRWLLWRTLSHGNRSWEATKTDEAQNATMATDRSSDAPSCPETDRGEHRCNFVTLS